MTKQELRIGNYLKYNKKPFKCCEIFNDSVQNEFWCKPLSVLEPILLTDSIYIILLGFNLKQINNGETGDINIMYYEKDGICISLSGYLIAINNNEYIRLGKPIKYLHQLQNIYCDLKQEELKMQL